MDVYLGAMNFYLDIGRGNHKHKGTYIDVDKYDADDIVIVRK